MMKSFIAIIKGRENQVFQLSFQLRGHVVMGVDCLLMESEGVVKLRVGLILKDNI
jgi:hypothetical protein